MTEQEFAKFVEDTKGLVLSCIEKYLVDRYHEAIDDIAQETYLRAYRSLQKNQFENRAKITTWLYVIARNETFRANKKLRKEEEKARKASEQFTPYAEDKKDDFLSEELGKIVRMLPGTYQSVMKAYMDGKSEKEIATQLELKVGTVKSRVSRGKNIMAGIARQRGLAV